MKCKSPVQTPPETSAPRNCNEEFTVLSVWMRPLADYLDSNGYDSEALFRNGGVDIEHIFLPSARIPLSKSANLWRTAAELTEKPFVGLEVYNQSSPLQGDSVAIAMMASRNLYEAMQRLERLAHWICDGVDVVVSRAGDQLHCEFIVRENATALMPVESLDPAFLMIFNLLHSGLAQRESVVKLCFKRSFPGEPQQRYLEALLQAPLEFDCNHYKVVFDWDVAQRLNPYWNPSLASLSEELTQRELHLLRSDDVIGRTRNLIQEQLPNGTPQLEDIASAMNISGRQLQRRLSAAKTSFGDLLQQIRQDLAYRLLKDPLMAMVDVSLSLGFQDQSNFTKAFKKWTGETPGQARKRLTQ